MSITRPSVARLASWAVVWLVCGLVVSLVCQDLVHLCVIRLFMAIDRTPTPVSFLSGLAWCFTGFWQVSQIWQGPGTIPMVLMTAFGVSAGLLRYEWKLRWIPVALAVSTFVAVLIYLGDVTNGDGFWKLLGAKFATLVVLAFAGVYWDRLLTQYVRPKILTVPRPIARKPSGRRVIDV